MYSLHGLEDLANLPVKQLELGFQSKFLMDNSLLGKTFLKGAFFLMKNQEEFKWLPLPSQILKVGKIMTDPAIIFKHVKEEQARVLGAVGMAKGLGTVPPNYPILGPFLEMYLRIGYRMFGNTDEYFDEDNIRYFKDDHKMQITERFLIDLDYAYSFMLARYDLSREEIEDFHSICRGVTHLPVVINHPVLTRLEVDYA